jgi:hypothetical protein
MNKLLIITGDNLSLIRKFQGAQVALWDFPECYKSKPEIVATVNEIVKYIYEPNLFKEPPIVTTLSLFVLRELYLVIGEKMKSEKIEVEWVNAKGDGTRQSDDLDNIGSLVTLDEELKQSDRYMNFENGFN